MGFQKVGFVFDGHRGVPNSDRANTVMGIREGGIHKFQIIFIYIYIYIYIFGLIGGGVFWTGLAFSFRFT